MGVAAGGPAPREPLGPLGPVGPVPLWRNRDFQLLWAGQAVSLLGSQTSKIAYPLLVLAMTGSPAKAGIAGFAAMLGYLLFPLPAGGLADRHDRKRIMIGCDAIRLAAVGSIAVAGWAAHITYVQVLMVGFIEGAATVFFSLAQRAALPMLVHQSQRSVAIGQNEARQNAAQLAGPALGGALFGLSWAAPFAADAVSYLASLCTLPFIRARMQASRREPAAPAPSQRQPVPSQRQPVPSQRQPDLSQRQPDLSQRQPDLSQRQPDLSQRQPDPPAASAPGAPRGLRAELGEGLAWTWRQPFLRYSAFFAAAVNILLQVLTLGLIVLARHDGASSAQIGIIVGCMGAGGLVGAFVAPRVQRKVPAGAAITSCMWIWAILLALIVLVRVPLWLCPIVAVFGFVGPSWNVSVQTYRMQITPNELLGRTSSVAVQIGWGVIPLGSLLAGFLLEALSPSAAMTAVAAGMAVTAVVATALAPVRDAGRRTPGASRSAGAGGAAPAAG
jgi:predicted MFS family arabinose efflux permease